MSGAGLTPEPPSNQDGKSVPFLSEAGEYVIDKNMHSSDQNHLQEVLVKLAVTCSEEVEHCCTRDRTSNDGLHNVIACFLLLLQMFIFCEY